jgi:hypothetical protein
MRDKGKRETGERHMVADAVGGERRDEIGG